MTIDPAGTDCSGFTGLQMSQGPVSANATPATKNTARKNMVFMTPLLPPEYGPERERKQGKT